MKFHFSVKFFILIILFCSLSCTQKQKELTFEEEQTVKQIQNLTYQINYYHLFGECELQNADSFYFPQELALLLNRRILKNNEKSPFNNLLGIEYYTNQHIGLIESSGFYEESENENWVDDALISIEEERIANEINEIESELETNSQIDFSETENDINSKLDENKQSKEIVDFANELKFMEFDNEILMPQKTDDGMYMIHAKQNNVELLKYDKQYRLLQKEIWNITSENQSTIEAQENFTYFDETHTVQTKTTQTKDTKKIITFNEESLIQSIKEYALKEDKEYITSETLRFYDAQNRVIKDSKTLYTYKKDYDKINYTFEKRYEYKYNEDNYQDNDQNTEDEIPPDFNYYENDILKMKNVYAKRKGAYTSQIFFEGGLSVKTIYVDNLRTRDIYYQDNEVSRIKDYE